MFNGFYNPYAAQMYGANGAMPDQLSYLRGMQNQPPQQPQQQQNGNGLKWVQGEAGAKSYPVNAGETAMLMDSESSVFYLKTVDASGMPLPLRIFDYSERTPSNNQNANAETAKGFDVNKFITREEFDVKMAQIVSLVQGTQTEPSANEGGTK